MIALLVALIFLLVNLAAIFPHPGLAPIQPAITFYQENQPDVLLVLMVFYFGLYVFARWRYAKLLVAFEEQESSKPETDASKSEKKEPLKSVILDENHKLKRQVHDLDKSLDEAQRELQVATERAHELQNALTDTKKHLSTIEQQTSKREPLIDAEIIHLLSLFQSKGRLLDFVMDDITPYTDDQIGRAARVVHQGCKAVLSEYFSITPVHVGQEGDQISVDSNSPTDRYKLVGRVAGAPPYHGRVLHQGWKTSKVSLPRVTKSESSGTESSELIIAPSEIEVR